MYRRKRVGEDMTIGIGTLRVRLDVRTWRVRGPVARERWLALGAWLLAGAGALVGACGGAL